MYRALQLQIVLLVCMVLLTACGSPGAGTPLAGTPVTDKEFNAAVEEAHNTFGTLREALLAPKSAYDFVGLKVRFTGDDTEDMWTELVDYYNGYFTIRMIAGVTVERGLNPDRHVSVSRDDVLDWMILEKDGTLIGGYTIRLTYEHMTLKEKEQFLRSTGYKMD